MAFCKKISDYFKFFLDNLGLRHFVENLATTALYPKPILCNIWMRILPSYDILHIVLTTVKVFL